jgi:hypothetical protein
MTDECAEGVGQCRIGYARRDSAAHWLTRQRSDSALAVKQRAKKFAPHLEPRWSNTGVANCLACGVARCLRPRGSLRLGAGTGSRGHPRPSPSGPRGLPASRGRGPDGDGRRTAVEGRPNRSRSIDAHADCRMTQGCSQTLQDRIDFAPGTGEQSPCGLRRGTRCGVGGRTIFGLRSRRRDRPMHGEVLLERSHGVPSAVFVPQCQMSPPPILDQPDEHPARVYGAIPLGVFCRSEYVQTFALGVVDEPLSDRRRVELRDALRFRQVPWRDALELQPASSQPQCGSTSRTACGGFLVPRS